jgi:hypothetical protein
MFTTVFKLVADEANAVKVYAHSEFFVFRLGSPTAGALLCQCLMVECQCQHDISPDFSGVQLRIKAAKLNGVIVGKKTVEIEKVVTAVVIMTGTAFAVPFIPDG